MGDFQIKTELGENLFEYIWFWIVFNKKELLVAEKSNIATSENFGFQLKLLVKVWASNNKGNFYFMEAVSNYVLPFMRPFLQEKRKLQIKTPEFKRILSCSILEDFYTKI